tara:strand:+ start:2355 stop:3077 length:723 start_codon:yes stop_codon:yes gene_type:complete
MATLNATLSLTSTTVTSSPITLSLASVLTVGSPNLGISREVANVITPTQLVPATSGTKYAYIAHLGKKKDGTTASTNTVSVSTVTSAPVAQTTTCLFNALFIAGDVIKLTIDGVLQSDITFSGNNATTADLVKTALLAHPAIRSVVVTTGGSSHSFALIGSAPGDAFTISAVVDPTSGSNSNAVITATGAATGSSFAVLRPGEFLFIPVKTGEGMKALAHGSLAAEGVMIEYAYWTKTVE